MGQKNSSSNILFHRRYMPYMGSPSPLNVITCIVICAALVAEQFLQCRAGSNSSGTLISRQQLNTTSIMGGLCHFCDLCASLEDVTENTVTTKVCPFTDNSTVRCMTKSIVYKDAPRDSDRTHYTDKIRGCFQNGTVDCVQQYLGIFAEDHHPHRPTKNDHGCLSTTVTSAVYTSYVSCITYARRKEWELIKGGGGGKEGKTVSSQTYATDEKNDSIQITICSCTGAFCNEHVQTQLDDAEVVHGKPTIEPENTANHFHGDWYFARLLFTVILSAWRLYPIS